MTDADLLNLDPSAELRAITNAQVDDLVMGLRYLLQAKVSRKRDDDALASEVHMNVAVARLQSAGVPGAVLLGDLGDAIRDARLGLLLMALAAREKGQADG